MSYTLNDENERIPPLLEGAKVHFRGRKAAYGGETRQPVFDPAAACCKRARNRNRERDQKAIGVEVGTRQ